MQSAEKINSIKSSAEDVTANRTEGSATEGPALEIHLSWSSLQVILCALAVIALVAIKELSPVLYSQVETRYEELMSADLFIGDSEISVIHEE